MCGSEAFLNAAMIRFAVLNIGFGKGTSMREILPEPMHWMLGRPSATPDEMQAGFESL